MMTERILNALLQLDVNNDEHWTSDGLPRMDAVEAIVGDKGITRQQVTAAKPGFSRALAAAGAQAPQTQGGEGNEDPDLKSAPAPAQAAGEPATANDTADETQQQEMDDESDADVSEARQALQQAKAELQELAKAKVEAEQAYEAKSLEVDALTDALIAEEGVETSIDAIQGYLAQQRRNLAERAERMKVIKESGINFANLQRNLTSPLDAALKGRK